MAKKNVFSPSRKKKADALIHQGRLAEACVLYAKVCQADRGDIEAWVKLGVTQRRLGNYGEAERAARQAVKLEPRLGVAHYTLASALHAQRKFNEAIENYRQAVALQPNFADAHYLLGNALHETGSMPEAVGCYRAALKFRPDYLEALSDLASALTSLGEIEEAAEILDRARRLRPDSPAVLCNLGSVLQLGGRTSEAEDLLQQALRLDPLGVDAMGCLAALQEKTGRVAAAKELLDRGLTLQPEHPTLNVVAANVARREGRIQDGIDLLEKLRGQELRPSVAGEVYILLGQLYDQKGDADRAFPLLVEGNRLAATAMLSNRDAHKTGYLKRVEMLTSLSRKGLATAEKRAGQPTEEPDPVFLIGFPRSGTTLLEQMLDSHPDLQALEEKRTVAVIVNTFLQMTGGDENALINLSQVQLNQLRKTYFDEVEKYIERRPGTLLVDKMPLNTARVPVIWRVFPKAKFIFATRHPCDVCLSCFMQHFAVNEGMAGFFTLEDTALVYSKVMSAWQQYRADLPLDYYQIRYEDLIDDVEQETRRLLEFLGVPWHDAVLHHTEHARQRGVIGTPSYHQVTQPIYQRAKYRWQRYSKKFDPVMDTLRPFIEFFGYSDGTS